MDDEIRQKWLDEEFELAIVKTKGRENTSQKYIGTKDGLCIAIATMTEQILRNKILTPDEFKESIKMALDKLKGEV